MFGPPKTSVTIEPPAPAMPATGMPGGPGVGDGDVHLLDRISVLYRYRKIVISVVALMLVAGAVQTYTTTPEYKAVAKVEVKPDRQAFQSAMDTTDDFFVQTEQAKMTSRDLVRRVLKTLNAGNNPELNEKAGQSSGLGAAIASVKTRIMSPLRSLLGQDHSPVAPPPAPPVPGQPGAPPANALAPETDAEARQIDAFISRLAVQPVPSSRLFTVEVRSSDPDFAARAANAQANEYVAQNLELKKTALTNRIADLTGQVKTAKAELDVANATAIETRRNTASPQLLDPNTLNMQMTQSMAAWDDAKAAVTGAQQKYDRLKAYNIDDPKTDVQKSGALSDPDIRTDGNVRGIRQQIKQVDDSLKSHELLGHAKNYPEVVQLNSTQAENQASLRLEIEGIVETAKKTLDTLKDGEITKQARYKSQEKTSNDMSTTVIDYTYLLNEIKQKETIFNKFKTDLEEANATASGIDNNVHKMESAEKPQRPFKPIASQNMLIALAVGLGLAAMLAFGLDYLDDTIKTPEDITRKLHLPFLGLVPAVHGDRQPVLSGPVPHDFGEAYRALRTSLVFTSGGEATRLITVTSAQPLEGKTTTACNLAMVLAFGGSRVLLIDADMRRPGVHKALKINNTVGLSHLLVGQARVREAIQRTSDPNFCVMTAGRTPPNPSELLSSDRMKHLIGNLRQGPFDWVVVDTPPVLAVTDAIILTPMADCALFVLGAEMTRRRLAERAVNMLLSSRPKVVGAVLNRVNFDRNKYYYSRYYGYQYKSYYGTNAGITASAPKE
jgi:capsular exopolysaccharide synthesis family protein